MKKFVVISTASFGILGGTQSTLQDVKLPNVSGGYVYSDQSHYLTRNRMIIWRTNHDNLELLETSLDWDLRKNRVKYRFQDTPVLSGVSIHETYHHVVILVATVSSVHKLRFPHPRMVHKQDLIQNHSEAQCKNFSIFSPIWFFVEKLQSFMISFWISLAFWSGWQLIRCL